MNTVYPSICLDLWLLSAMFCSFQCAGLCRVSVLSHILTRNGHRLGKLQVCSNSYSGWLIEQNTFWGHLLGVNMWYQQLPIFLARERPGAATWGLMSLSGCHPAELQDQPKFLGASYPTQAWRSDPQEQGWACLAESLRLPRSQLREHLSWHGSSPQIRMCPLSHFLGDYSKFFQENTHRWEIARSVPLMPKTKK